MYNFRIHVTGRRKKSKKKKGKKKDIHLKNVQLQPEEFLAYLAVIACCLQEGRQFFFFFWGRKKHFALHITFLEVMLLSFSHCFPMSRGQNIHTGNVFHGNISVHMHMTYMRGVLKTSWVLIKKRKKRKSKHVMFG